MKRDSAIDVGLMFLEKVSGNWYLVARLTAAAAAIDPATSHQPPATVAQSGYVTMFATPIQQQKAQDFLIAHAFASLTTSSVWG